MGEVQLTLVEKIDRCMLSLGRLASALARAREDYGKKPVNLAALHLQKRNLEAGVSWFDEVLEQLRQEQWAEDADPLKKGEAHGE